MFSRCGVIHIDKRKISEEEAFEIAINSGAKDCSRIEGFHEILTKRKISIKSKRNRKENENFAYSAIEWRALNYLDLNKDQSKRW